MGKGPHTMTRYPNMTEAYEDSFINLLLEGEEITPERWQGKDRADTMIEMLHVTFTTRIASSREGLSRDTNCNQPWAEMHFLERVGGKPLNPGNTYKEWPFFVGNVPDHQGEGGKFTHTYMERFWPKVAGVDPSSYGEHESLEVLRNGIRYPYGDLEDVFLQLLREPGTRQAYLPVWFPEDTGATHGGRVPCTLGYHFIRRQGQLHCMYPIRSCDIVRHLPDDMYLAGRLVQWLLNKLTNVDPDNWSHIEPGDLTMAIGSLHCWAVERPIWEKKFDL